MQLWGIIFEDDFSDPGSGRPIDDDGQSRLTVDCPSAPYLYTIDNPDCDSSYLVHWEPPAGSISNITVYVLQEDTDSSWLHPTEVYRNIFRLVQITGTAPGTYYYRVKAVNPDCEGPWSNVRSVKVCGAVDTNPPTITNIRESADPINRQPCPSPNTVTISADISDASGLAWVRLYFEPPGGSWTYATMPHSSGNTYSATAGPFSQAGTLMYYVKARDNADNEAQSSTSTVTVNDCAPTLTHTATRMPTRTPTPTSSPTVGSTPTRTATPTPTATPLLCSEPANDTRAGACGPLMPVIQYRGYIAPVDDRDWFYFDMATAHTIYALLTNIPDDCDYELYLTDYRGGLIAYSATGGNVDELILTEPLPAGQYYVLVFGADSTWNDSHSYILSVEYGMPGPTRLPSPTSWPQHKLRMPMILKVFQA